MRLKLPNIKGSTNQNKAVIGFAAVVAVGLIAFAAYQYSRTPNNSTNESGDGPTALVQITAEGFVPATVMVLPGSLVTWTNTDNKPHRVASNPHPTHSDVQGLESPDIAPGESYTYRYGQQGSFGYHDHLNFTRTGTVIVE